METPSLALRSRLGHWCVLARGPSVPHPLLQEPGQSQWVAAMILRMFHPKSTAQSLCNASGRGSICRMLRRVPTGSGHRGHRACAGSEASCRSQTATGHGYFLQTTWTTMPRMTTMMNYQDAVPDIVFLRHRNCGWHGRSMRYNITIRSETREAWNKNGMDAGGVLFFLVARAVCACIYVMVLLLLLC